MGETVSKFKSQIRMQSLLSCIGFTGRRFCTGKLKGCGQSAEQHTVTYLAHARLYPFVGCLQAVGSQKAVGLNYLAWQATHALAFMQAVGGVSKSLLK